MSQLPVEVVAAVEHLNADPAVPFNDLEPGALLDFRVYPDRVAVILFTGQKYTVSLAALQRRLAGRVAKVLSKSKLPDNTLAQ